MFSKRESVFRRAVLLPLMNSKKSWDLKVDSSIYRFLKDLSLKEAEHVVASISRIQEDPQYRGELKQVPLGDDQYTWRRRCGAFYIWYDIHVPQRMVHVTLVERVR